MVSLDTVGVTGSIPVSPTIRRQQTLRPDTRRQEISIPSRASLLLVLSILLLVDDALLGSGAVECLERGSAVRSSRIAPWFNSVPLRRPVAISGLMGMSAAFLGSVGGCSTSSPGSAAGCGSGTRCGHRGDKFRVASAFRKPAAVANRSRKLRNSYY